MILAYRLVRLIERNSEALASSLLDKVQHSDSLSNYRKVPSEELERRVYEIYQHLGDWLLGNTRTELEHRYWQIGVRRSVQKVPFSELLWVIILTKENLWEFLRDEFPPEHPADVMAELEVLQLLDQFFDRAIHFAALGYEHAGVEDQPVESIT